ncbi:MAG: hypothetical protein JNM58_17430 [Xanthomonadaceae bacterium]|nr:hypothetical protein [Xanthomonadaceae bacterium]
MEEHSAMINFGDTFIQLDRTFHELVPGEDATDDTVLSRLLRKQRALHWADVLAHHRTVLLSEAGSGKTMEVRQAARRLRDEGKPAFFLRIESVIQDFETAFEVGTYAEFLTWCESGVEGWLLLDSVDEARLRDSKDFERAIKAVGLKLGSTMQNAHIVITGRSSAWRTKTDPLLCNAVFRYQEPRLAAKEGEDAHPHQAETEERSDPKHPFAPLRILALADLEGEQIDVFLRGHGVADAAAFRRAVEQKDALHLMSRPQDLSELADFWNEHARIGSKLELLQNSIKRRLQERDQDRAEALSISPEKLRTGARLIAATATLTQNSVIQVPDGTGTPTGLAVRDILQDWDEKECQSLLQRPIFEPGIYGAVRFHHRSVREYLAAEWFHNLLANEAPRLRIDGLFFRNQYGIDVVVPSMRSILPWLAILHPPVLDHVIRLAPEILFEGGDPSQLNRDIRIKVLREVCEHLSQPAHTYPSSYLSSAELFVDVDLTDEIKALLAKHEGNADISWLLLRMVWRGEIIGALPEARALAQSGRDINTRIAAFQALEVIGSETDRALVRQRFLAEQGNDAREWLAELAKDMPVDIGGVDWLLAALTKVSRKKRYAYDPLARVLGEKIQIMPASLLPHLLDGLYALLITPPLVERIHYGVSEKYAWLTKCISLLVSRMIREQDAAMLGSSALSVLSMLPELAAYGEDVGTDEPADDLSIAIPRWGELNRALFWHAAGHARMRLEKKAERLTDYWRVGAFHSYWRFDESYFEHFLEDTRSRSELDDRLVAQSLAFALYRQAGRPPTWLRQMKLVAKSEPQISGALHKLLHPPKSEWAAFRRQDAKFKRQAKARHEREERNKQEWKQWLASNLGSVRSAAKPGVPTNAQYYLHNQIREGKGSSGKWTDGNWPSLIPEFGELLAEAYREGATTFWRGYEPELRSERAVENSTPFAVIFGLTGLAIEAREVEGWADSLSREEVLRATRYALLELNGFPDWMPRLFAVHSQAVLEVVNREIDNEFAHAGPDTPSRDLLSTISWSGAWMWDDLAPVMIERLSKSPKSLSMLEHVLEILHGSNLSDAAIAQLAARKARTTRNLHLGPLWFASWAGVAPDVAIPSLSAHLAGLATAKDQTLFAMTFITALVGGRRRTKNAREAYRTVAHMKALYLLMHRYIRESEDIDRANQGAYSPVLRDDAQDARNALISFIKETPGKEAYLAMMEISAAHPSEQSRPWMAYRAKEKAIADADMAPWSVDQVLSFRDRLERTPRNHREMWDLAIDRIRDYGYDLEHGDTSIAQSMLELDERAIRQFIGNALKERAQSRYTISQESELADAKKPDIQFHGAGFGSVPCELKLAERWTGPSLFERLEVQLCGDYLRDRQSNRGIFLLVYAGGQKRWAHPNGTQIKGLKALVEALQNYWLTISPQFAGVEDIRVMGIDLTQRGIDGKARAGEKRAKATPTKKTKKTGTKSSASKAKRTP